MPTAIMKDMDNSPLNQVHRKTINRTWVNLFIRGLIDEKKFLEKVPEAVGYQEVVEGLRKQRIQNLEKTGV